MPALLQILEQRFKEVKDNPLIADEFFDTFFRSSTMLPKKDAIALMHEVHKWAVGNESLPRYISGLSIHALGIMHFHADEIEQAINYYAEAYKFFEEAGYSDGIAVAAGGIGSCYRTLGDVELSLKYLTKSAEQLERSGKYTFQYGISCYQLGGIYTTTKNLETALRYFEKATEKEKDPVLTAISQAGIANVLLLQNNYLQAREYYEKALATGMINPVIGSRLLTDMANWHFKTGNMAEAMRYNNEAADIRRKMNQRAALITNLLNIADIYREEQELKNAVDTLNNALQEAIILGIKPKILPIHKKLSEIYAATAQMDKSYMHFRKFHDMAEEVNKDEAQKKVKNFQTVYEAEQTRKENAIIKSQKEEIQDKNIKLQNTIDELTRVKVSRKAKAIAFVITITLIIVEDLLNHFVVHPLLHENFYFSFVAKVAIVVALKPIEQAIEHYLLHKVIFKRKKNMIQHA